MSGKKLFFVVLILCLLMVNPPILYWVNDYCAANPLTFGWPTMYVWLQFWFVLMIVDFVAAALLLKDWDCRQDKKPIEQVEREMV